MDLYKHEYAHYMQAHMKIPEKYQWQTGKHGKRLEILLFSGWSGTDALL